MDQIKTIKECMEEMTSKESTIEAITSLITFHVENALEAAFDAWEEDKNILNSYPLTNIK